jgi:hypothetical protein
MICDTRCAHPVFARTLSLTQDHVIQVLPAAQPSFLQEVVILDHDPATVPLPPGVKPPPSNPTRAIVMMGQTSKKFLVVPEVSHLLSRVAEEEKEEKERLKAVKKERAKE